MTPEERAHAVTQDLDPDVLDFSKYQAAIAVAIREAVDAETEACAELADAEQRTDSARDDRYHNACDEIAQQIRQRAAARRARDVR